MNRICLKADFRGKHKVLSKKWRDPNLCYIEITPRLARLQFIQLKTNWETATYGRESVVSILVLLVFPLNYVFIVVMPANYTACAHAFDSAI